jgi:metal-responsive CopG/Arc/MetJ family transcriptional regulator
MGRKRLNYDDLKIVISIRLTRELLKSIDYHGKRSEIIEQAIKEYIDNLNKKNS